VCPIEREIESSCLSARPRIVDHTVKETFVIRFQGPNNQNHLGHFLRPFHLVREREIYSMRVGRSAHRRGVDNSKRIGTGDSSVCFCSGFWNWWSLSIFVVASNDNGFSWFFDIKALVLSKVIVSSVPRTVYPRGRSVCRCSVGGQWE
jgi:hypothetical protein